MPGYESNFDEVFGDLLKIAARVRTTPMDSEWKQRLDMQDSLTDPARQKLRDKLLSYGGEEALIRSSDIPSEEVERLLTRGQFWLGTRAVTDFKKMEAINCHGNSACLMREGLGEVVNGYALSPDGLWRNHSWLLQPNGKLIETTVRRKAYFGVVLTRAEVKMEIEG